MSGESIKWYWHNRAWARFLLLWGTYFYKVWSNILHIIILETNRRLIHFSWKDFKGFTGRSSRKLKWLDNLSKLPPGGFGLESMYSSSSFLNLTQRSLGESTVLGSSLLSSPQIPSLASRAPLPTCQYHVFWGEWRRSGLNLASFQGSPQSVVPV